MVWQSNSKLSPVFWKTSLNFGKGNMPTLFYEAQNISSQLFHLKILSPSRP